MQVKVLNLNELNINKHIGKLKVSQVSVRDGLTRSNGFLVGRLFVPS